MFDLKQHKCKDCGSQNIGAEEGDEEIRIRCKDCGRELVIPKFDPFLTQLYAKLIEIANSLKSDYYTYLWNKYNEEDCK